jgi:prepilin-type N-terminal cleavage/methylation domain-containing protein
MLNKLKKSDAKGFTIIEVMIVLAIAGLIILIVLLAVPALQRNSRNTALKTDASSVAGAVTEFKSNNDGAQPTAIAIAGTGVVTVSGGAGTVEASGKVQPATTAANTATPGNGVIGYQIGAVCPGSTAATSRSVAIYYRVESTSATAVYKCIET